MANCYQDGHDWCTELKVFAENMESALENGDLDFYHKVKKAFVWQVNQMVLKGIISKDDAHTIGWKLTEIGAQIIYGQIRSSA